MSIKIIKTKRYIELLDLESNFKEKLKNFENRIERRLYLEEVSRYNIFMEEKIRSQNRTGELHKEYLEENDELKEKIISLKNKINILIKKIK